MLENQYDAHVKNLINEFLKERIKPPLLLLYIFSSWGSVWLDGKNLLKRILRQHDSFHILFDFSVIAAGRLDWSLSLSILDNSITQKIKNPESEETIQSREKKVGEHQHGA